MLPLSPGVILLIGIGVLSLWYFRPFRIAEAHNEPVLNLSLAKIFKDERTCLQILEGGRCGDGVNRHPAIFSRAIPNSRLIGAFGIDNAFTTKDQQQKAIFTKLAANFLQVSSNKSYYDWDQLRQKAKCIVKDTLVGHHTFVLVPLVQSLTLRMTFAIFFCVDPETVNYQTAKDIADGINKLWLASKDSTNIPKWTNQNNLHRLLESVIPGKSPLDRVHNPMNVILPAYETLWRVVLRCFIEIIDEERCGEQNSTAWRAVLKKFLEDPGQQQARKSGKLSVFTIAKEALRLYPPTRRVYRMFKLDPASSSAGPVEQLVAADVEAYQRDPSIWGLDADKFNPDRWATLFNQKLLAFGAKPFLCPASADFGFRTIALLTAALVIGIEEGGHNILRDHKKDYPMPGQPLESGREAYAALELFAPTS
ncbi:uncharacterized protein K441DRAFT_670129 [Cenococcum geophilum 1.58]|uniref:Uncharacterized protein n=1 Tax=Cenococcum geophilum 1.58 TaxID=794803 RepID=A0ACC8ENA3_9PEZI|nr:hypothetical protein K441DRAFT_670129 [Cenococcum geophilum 1.58]